MQGNNTRKRERSRNNNSNSNNSNKLTAIEKKARENEENNSKSVISGITQVNNNENGLQPVPMIRFDEPFSEELFISAINTPGTLIAKGGFGKAERINLFGRSFVKKISLLTDRIRKFDEQNRKRVFENEVKILEKLRGDPYVPYLYAAGIYRDENNLEYGIVIIEDIIGMDLIELNKSGRGLLKEERILIIHLLKLAIQHLHSSGFLHLDIKPENIIIRMDKNVILGLVIIDYGLTMQYALLGANKRMKPLPTTSLPIYLTPRYASDKLLSEFKRFMGNIAQQEKQKGIQINRWTYNYDKHKAYRYKYSTANNIASYEKTILIALPPNEIIADVDTPEALQHFTRLTQPRFFETTREESLQNCIDNLTKLLEDPQTEEFVKPALIKSINRIVANKQPLQSSSTYLSTLSSLSSIAEQDTTLHDLIKDENFSLETFKKLISSGADTDAVNSQGKTVLEIIDEKLAEIEQSMQVAMVSTAHNKRIALEQKYKAAKAFLEAGVIKVGGKWKKHKTRKSKRISYK